MPDFGGDIERGAAKVAGIYLLIAITWVILTDLGVLGLVIDPATLTGLQTAKGVFFVTASALLLYVLIAREQRRLTDTNAELQLTLRHASVLHRLLRHNLRNSCDVIMNNVELLKQDRGDTEAAYARIERQTGNLVGIAEKSRHLRSLVLTEDPEPRPVDFVRVVDERVAAVEKDFPRATIEVDAPAEARGQAHPRIAIGIEEVILNAIAHVEADAPTVRIRIEVTEDAVTVAVADEGPGLPEMELSALDGMVEAPLEHSRGIGLWLVQFLVAKSDATLETSANDPSGTVVRLTFERVE